MPSSDSDSDLKSRPTKKFKALHDDNAQLFEKNNLSRPLLLNENISNSAVENCQNDNANDETTSNLNIEKRNNQSESSEESDSANSCTKNKCDNSESDYYVPISDSEFELEKFTVNDETNIKSSTNENVKIESDKGDKCLDPVNTKSALSYNSTDIDNDEVYELLDQLYQDKNANQSETVKKGVTKDDFKEYEKIVLEEVCKNHFDILPENWIEATHKSGMPIYLHKKSRVVTLSRPYFLGPGDPRSHLAPLSAISCLQYIKGLESKENLKNEPDFQVSKLGDMIIPNAKVETAQENILKESLSHEELREYCQKLFK